MQGKSLAKTYDRKAATTIVVDFPITLHSFSVLTCI